ncbi:hypothetical protein DFH11DRAFT_1544029 [Phellopilus nigrolimitatus]|nr:hypothetical protein DFH11DRAFT_1544029 [Phellopilus nigrolimitatus]
MATWLENTRNREVHDKDDVRVGFEDNGKVERVHNSLYDYPRGPLSVTPASLADTSRTISHLKCLSSVYNHTLLRSYDYIVICMSLNWTSSDSSRLENASGNGVQPVAGPSRTDRARSKPGGLQDINDFDFETLIELLGTSGEGLKHADNDGGNLQVREERRSFLDEGTYLVDPTPPVSPPRENPPGTADVDLLSAGHPVAPKAPNLVGARESTTPISPLDLPPTDLSPDDQPAPREEQMSDLIELSDGRKTKGKSMASPTGFSSLNKELGTSVRETKQHVADLRSRIQSLKDEVKEFAPHLYRRAFDSPQTRPKARERVRFSQDRRNDGDGNDLEPPVVPSLKEDARIEQPRTTVHDTVAQLSGKEAKNALANICQALHVDPLDFVSPTQQDPFTIDLPRNMADLSRALHLVSDMDELVWRRKNMRPEQSRDQEGQDAYNNIYSEENIRALMDRVRLWERTARSRAGRSSGS